MLREVCVAKGQDHKVLFFLSSYKDSSSTCNTSKRVLCYMEYSFLWVSRTICTRILHSDEKEKEESEKKCEKC